MLKLHDILLRELKLANENFNKKYSKKNMIYILKKIGFWFPILLSMILYGNQLDSNLYIVLGNILLSTLIILLCNLIYHKKLLFLFETMSVIFFNIILFIQIAHFQLFNGYPCNIYFIILRIPGWKCVELNSAV